MVLIWGSYIISKLAHEFGLYSYICTSIFQISHNSKAFYAYNFGGCSYYIFLVPRGGVLGRILGERPFFWEPQFWTPGPALHSLATVLIDPVGMVARRGEAGLWLIGYSGREGVLSLPSTAEFMFSVSYRLASIACSQTQQPTAMNQMVRG